MGCVHTGPTLDSEFGPRRQPNWSFLELRNRQPAAWTHHSTHLALLRSPTQRAFSVYTGGGGRAELVAVAAHFQDPVPSRTPLATCEY